MSLPSASCSRCQAEVDPQASSCPVCGQPRGPAAPVVWSSEIIAPPMPSPVPRPSVQSSSGIRQFADNPWVVLATIFFATAAFGIPLIWMCKAWSRPMKIVLTVITILYTILILWLFYLVMAWCYRSIVGSL